MNATNNFTLVRALGGSRAYGLENPNSDYDYRGVFLNTDLRFVLGLDKYEHQEFTDGEDVKLKEFRHFLSMLRKSNTEAMELMFAEEFLEVHPLFTELQKHKYELLDSTQAFNCLRGYMQGEKKLANGERSGKLGGKRKESLDRYGFSPKNFVQLFRLAWAGTVLFNEGVFPVRVSSYDKEYAAFLLDVKNNPANYNKHDLNAMTDENEKKLVKAFENRKFDYKFNNELANNFVLRAYFPLLKELHGRL